MKIINYYSLSLLFLYVSLHQRALASHNLASSSGISQINSTIFWNSIEAVLLDTGETLHDIANRLAKLDSGVSECSHTIEIAFRHGLKHAWSSKLIGANRALSSILWIGLVSEQHLMLGDFDGCLSLHNVTIEPSIAAFDGKYCLVSIHTPSLGSHDKLEIVDQFTNEMGHFGQIANEWLETRNRIPMTVGICAPSLCSEHELRTLINEYFKRYLTGMIVEIGYCQQPDNGRQMTQNDRFGLLIAKMIIGVTVATCLGCTLLGSSIAWICTIIGARGFPIMSSMASVCNCFDSLRNLRRLFRADHGDSQSNEPYDLTFIYGLKAVLITCSVFIHSTTFLTIYLLSRMPLFGKYRSFLREFQQQHTFYYNFIYRSVLLVDLFFVVSGFLATFTCLSQNKRRPNVFHYIFVHWLRLAPSMIAIVCLTIVLQQFGSGPLFHPELTDPYVKPCYEQWWTHVLLINNFWTIDKMCGPNLWFISADFQLHILLFAVLAIYYKSPRFAFIFALVLMALSLLLYPIYNFLALPGLPRVDFQMNLHSSAPLQSFRLFYTSPQLHILGYFSGVLIAMHFAGTRITPSRYLHSILVRIFSVLFLIPTIVPLPALQLLENESHNLSALCIFLLLFAITILCEAAFFYFLILDKSTLIKQLCASKFLMPIGRLSFAMYLLNALINWHHLHQTRNSPSLTFHFLSDMFAIDFLRCFIGAILFHVFFQAPFQNLRQLYTRKMSNRFRENAICATSKIAKTTSSSSLKHMNVVI